MYETLGILLFLSTMVVHEAGHAIAMYRRGILIDEIVFGIKLYKLPSFFARIVKIGTEIIMIKVHHIPIVAYVQPNENDIDSCSYDESAAINGAGIIVNLIYGAVLLAIRELVIPNTDWVLASILAVSAIAICIFRKPFIKYVLPILGLATLAFLVYRVAQNPEIIRGIIGIFLMIFENVHDLESALRFGGMISILIGLFNSMPIFPLDGGQTVAAYLKEKKVHKTLYAVVYGIISLVLILSILVYSIYLDILRCLA